MTTTPVGPDTKLGTRNGTNARRRRIVLHFQEVTNAWRSVEEISAELGLSTTDVFSDVAWLEGRNWLLRRKASRSEMSAACPRVYLYAVSDDDGSEPPTRLPGDVNSRLDGGGLPSIDLPTLIREIEERLALLKTLQL